MEQLLLSNIRIGKSHVLNLDDKESPLTKMAIEVYKPQTDEKLFDCYVHKPSADHVWWIIRTSHRLIYRDNDQHATIKTRRVVNSNISVKYDKSKNNLVITRFDKVNTKILVSVQVNNAEFAKNIETMFPEIPLVKMPNAIPCLDSSTSSSNSGSASSALSDAKSMLNDVASTSCSSSSITTLSANNIKMTDIIDSMQVKVSHNTLIIPAPTVLNNTDISSKWMKLKIQYEKQQSLAVELKELESVYTKYKVPALADRISQIKIDIAKNNISPQTLTYDEICTLVAHS